MGIKGFEMRDARCGMRDGANLDSSRIPHPVSRIRGLRRLASVAFLAAVLAAQPACRQDMQDQPKYKDLRGSSFFADGRSARPLPEGTVARGFLFADQRLWTGKQDGQLIATLPMPLTRELLERGRERYGIYCSPCHGLLGDGLGIVVQRGFRRPNSFQIDRLRAAPVAYFFDVETRGFGSMMDYAAQVPTEDRWAIAAYVRALQLSQGATLADVPAGERPALESPEAPNRPAALPLETDDWKGAPGLEPTKKPSGPGDH
jgi:cbb3-type cytochrome c oxidase subunit III